MTYHNRLTITYGPVPAPAQWVGLIRACLQTGAMEAGSSGQEEVVIAAGSAPETEATSPQPKSIIGKTSAVPMQWYGLVLATVLLVGLIVVGLVMAHSTSLAGLVAGDIF